MLRMKFEEKMNHLHSLNRCFQESSTHNRAMLIEKETEVLQLRELFDESQQKLKKISVEKDNVDQWKAVAEKKITLIEYELKVTKEIYNSQKD